MTLREIIPVLLEHLFRPLIDAVGYCYQNYGRQVGDAMSITGSAGLLGGGVVWGQATTQTQSFYGALISVCGLITLALPYIFKELDRRREERGVARKLAEAQRKIADLEARQVQPNTVQIAALGGQFQSLREDLVKAGVLKATPSTDSMPTIKPALLVEDDPDAAAAMAKVLTSAFYEVKAVSTLEAAMEALPALPYRLVLLDLGLPDGDGLDVVRAARRAKMDCRFVVTTGYSDDARRDRVASALSPRDRLMVKPIDFHELMGAVLPPRQQEDSRCGDTSTS